MTYVPSIHTRLLRMKITACDRGGSDSISRRGRARRVGVRERGKEGGDDRSTVGVGGILERDYAEAPRRPAHFFVSIAANILPHNSLYYTASAYLRVFPRGIRQRLLGKERERKKKGIRAREEHLLAATGVRASARSLSRFSRFSRFSVRAAGVSPL